MSRKTPPNTTHVTFTEGGQWVPFAPSTFTKVHAIKFDNGWIWDAVNGWRQVRDPKSEQFDE